MSISSVIFFGSSLYYMIDPREVITRNTYNCVLQSNEVDSILETLQSNNLRPQDFYYTKDKNGNIILVMKYTSMISYLIDKIDFMDFEHGDNYVDVIIKRKGFKRPMRWRVHYEDCNKTGGMWDTQFHFMCKKKAISQCLRVLFSDYFMNLPFTIYGDSEFEYDESMKPSDKNDKKPVLNKDKVVQFELDVLDLVKSKKQDEDDLVNEQLKNTELF